MHADFPGGPVLRLCGSNSREHGSIPGWGIKIPHAMQCGKKKKKKICGNCEVALGSSETLMDIRMCGPAQRQGLEEMTLEELWGSLKVGPHLCLLRP